MKRLILGSQSPRRKEILEYFGIPFEIASPPFVEEAVPFRGDPAAYVLEISKGKAESLSHLYPHAVILTADTSVFCRGKIFNKPDSEEEAIAFLSEFSGQWQSIFTGVTVRRGDEEHQNFEETRLRFNELTAEQIRQFVAKKLWVGKAGGYTIQAAGSLLVKEIEGCYYNVTGLPVNTTRDLLKKVGIDLWH
jgi:septum formation protein